MAKRKPCGKPVKDDLGQYACGYERAPGLQQCRWHWLMRQSAAIQKEWAAKRLAAYDEGGFPRRDRRPKSEWLPGTRWCSGCQDYVPLFYCQGSRCRSCNSEAAHGARIEKVYGITPEEYAALFKLQDGRCYICRRQTKKRLAGSWSTSNIRRTSACRFRGGTRRPRIGSRRHRTWPRSPAQAIRGDRPRSSPADAQKPLPTQTRQGLLSYLRQRRPGGIRVPQAVGFGVT
jgi:hypothetical protein